MPGRTILKDRDAKPLIEELNKIPGLDQLSHKSRVETEIVKNSEVIFVDGQPVAFKRGGQLVPVLTNASALDKMPRITVDMGAVPHVVGGADVMAPGVRGFQGNFGEKLLEFLSNSVRQIFKVAGLFSRESSNSFHLDLMFQHGALSPLRESASPTGTG